MEAEVVRFIEMERLSGGGKVSALSVPAISS